MLPRTFLPIATQLPNLTHQGGFSLMIASKATRGCENTSSLVQSSISDFSAELFRSATFIITCRTHFINFCLLRATNTHTLARSSACTKLHDRISFLFSAVGFTTHYEGSTVTLGLQKSTPTHSALQTQNSRCGRGRGRPGEPRREGHKRLVPLPVRSSPSGRRSATE